MTNNPNTKYTDLTQSQRLKKIGFEDMPDGWRDLETGKFYYDAEISEIKGIRFLVHSGPINVIPAYRLDTLLGHVKYPAHELQTALCRLDIVAAIAAAVDLIVLLKEVENHA